MHEQAPIGSERSNSTIILRDRDLGEFSPIKELARKFSKEVIGQERACEDVARRLILIKAGFVRPDRPRGVLMFHGPTGVGKTELAKLVAKYLYPDDWEDHLMEIEGTDLMKSTSLGRLTGGDPTFVGFGVKSSIDPVKLEKGAVTVINEAEKAHLDTLRWFMKPMEKGIATVYTKTGKENTATGREEVAPVDYDFRKSILIFTVNEGAEEVQNALKKNPVGFERKAYSKKEILEIGDKALREGTFSSIPEFLNRFDDIVPFNYLEPHHHDEILQRFIRSFNQFPGNGDSNRLSISATPKLRKHILSHADTSLYGAREIDRTLNKIYIEKVAEHKARGKIPEDSNYEVTGDLEDNEIVLLVSPSAADTEEKTYKNKVVNNKKEPTRTEEVGQQLTQIGLDQIEHNLELHLKIMKSGQKSAGVAVYGLYMLKAGIFFSKGNVFEGLRASEKAKEIQSKFF